MGAIRTHSTGVEVTPLGKAFSCLATDVWTAMMLTESAKYKCQDAMLSIVAMIAATDGNGNVFIGQTSNKGKKAVEASAEHFGQQRGDHIMLLNVHLAWGKACEKEEQFGDGALKKFLDEYYLRENVLRSADETRRHLAQQLYDLKDKKLWYAGGKPTSDPRYYTRVLCALAATHFLRTARVMPRQGVTKEILCETHSTGERAELAKTGCVPVAGQDWIIYN